MRYQENTMFILYIILFVINLLIYINSEYIFNMLMYYGKNDKYLGSLINLGSSPLSLGNNCKLKYSNELYTQILTLSKQYVGDISKLSIVEIPCVNVNSAKHISNKFNPKKVTCITEYKLFVNLINEISNDNQIEYKLGNAKNLTKLKIDNKSVDLVLSVEVNRNKYDYNIIASNLKNFLTPTKFWIIADIFELKTFKDFKNLLKKNKFTIRYIYNITSNIISSIECDNNRKKEQFISNLPLLKKYTIEKFITTDSTIYNDLINGTKQYLVIITIR